MILSVGNLLSELMQRNYYICRDSYTGNINAKEILEHTFVDLYGSQSHCAWKSVILCLEVSQFVDCSLCAH